MVLFKKAKVRMRTTTPTGDNPKNILGGKNMADNVTKSINILKPQNFTSMAIQGMQVFGGLMAAGVVNRFIGPRIPSIGPISGRTLTGAGSSVLLFWGSTMVGQGAVKNALKFGTIGAVAFTAGSLTMDLLNMANINVGEGVKSVVGGLTGQQVVA